MSVRHVFDLDLSEQDFGERKSRLDLSKLYSYDIFSDFLVHRFQILLDDFLASKFQLTSDQHTRMHATIVMLLTTLISNVTYPQQSDTKQNTYIA